MKHVQSFTTMDSLLQWDYDFGCTSDSSKPDADVNQKPKIDNSIFTSPTYIDLNTHTININYINTYIIDFNFVKDSQNPIISKLYHKMQSLWHLNAIHPDSLPQGPLQHVRLLPEHSPCPGALLREGCKIKNRLNLGHCSNRREGGLKDCANVPTLIFNLKFSMTFLKIVMLYH